MSGHTVNTDGEKVTEIRAPKVIKKRDCVVGGNRYSSNSTWNQQTILIYIFTAEGERMFEKPGRPTPR